MGARAAQVHVSPADLIDTGSYGGVISEVSLDVGGDDLTLDSVSLDKPLARNVRHDRQDQ